MHAAMRPSRHWRLEYARPLGNIGLNALVYVLGRVPALPLATTPGVSNWRLEYAAI